MPNAESAKSKAKKKKAHRAQSTNEYAQSSVLSANVGSTVLKINHDVELGDSTLPRGNCKDSLQEEFDRILDQKNEKLNFLNSSIYGPQKRAQSSQSNYHLDRGQQVGRQNTEKKKNKRREQQVRQKNVTEVEKQDYGPLSD